MASAGAVFYHRTAPHRNSSFAMSSKFHSQSCTYDVHWRPAAHVVSDPFDAGVMFRIFNHCLRPKQGNTDAILTLCSHAQTCRALVTSGLFSAPRRPATVSLYSQSSLKTSLPLKRYKKYIEMLDSVRAREFHGCNLSWRQIGKSTHHTLVWLDTPSHRWKFITACATTFSCSLLPTTSAPCPGFCQAEI